MHYILDNGHGGILNGVYQTSGKRSPIWEDGRQLFEGDFNRAVVNELSMLCKVHNISHTVLVPELEDVSLERRVQRANDIYKYRLDSVLISVHANAGGGTGFEIFTSVGETKSDPLSEIMIDQFSATIPTLKLRADNSDGDKDKEAHFYILKYTHCPAMLIECAFMDTLKPDCEMMMDNPLVFARAIFNGIKNIEHRTK